MKSIAFKVCEHEYMNIGPLIIEFATPPFMSLKLAYKTYNSTRIFLYDGNQV